MLGNKIIQLRENLNLSQKELAIKLNINVSVMNRIELGERPVRDTELIQIAKYFNVSTDYLLGITNNSKQSNISIDEQIKSTYGKWALAILERTKNNDLLQGRLLGYLDKLDDIDNMENKKIDDMVS